MTNKHLSEMCAQLQQLLVVTDAEGNIRYDNGFATALAGQTLTLKNSRDLARTLERKTRGQIFSKLRAAKAAPGIEQLSYARLKNSLASEQCIEISLTKDVHSASLFITARRAKGLYLSDQSLIDPLTQLPNRSALIARAQEQCDENKSYTLLYIDLDFFKAINDQFGHDVGDKLLVQMTERLAASIRAQDMLARIGGDEFVVLRPGKDSESDAENAASALIQALQEPMIVRGNRLKVEASVGIAMAPKHAIAPQDMLRDADVAMYNAKKKGRNQLAFFDEHMRARALRHARLANALQFALERDEFDVVFQPKYRLSDMELVGFEALLRWESSEFGSISPAEFIPIAEQSSVIRSIGQHVMAESCKHLARWQNEFANAANLHVAVNVSPKQLLVDEFVDELQSTLQTTGVNPACLEIEVTESAVMDNPIQSQMTLIRVKALGVRIALDDFGTGYSSLAYVRRLPLDTIKIDRSFVMGLGLDDGDFDVIRTVLAFAKAKQLETVAEGVESQEVAEQLRAMGCDLAQGYLFSKPLTGTSMRYLLADTLGDAHRNVAA